MVWAEGWFRVVLGHSPLLAHGLAYILPGANHATQASQFRQHASPTEAAALQGAHRANEGALPEQRGRHSGGHCIPQRGGLPGGREREVQPCMQSNQMFQHQGVG